jgi:hypothetical protein
MSIAILAKNEVLGVGALGTHGCGIDFSLWASECLCHNVRHE